jgi:hypothetical protein
MSAKDLKAIMHHRIDQLSDAETVQDLFLTINTFLDGRVEPSKDDSLELVTQLENSLAKVKAGQRGISTDELEIKIQQWRTR